uniref:Uncharacterized protein n=1 Tax=Triticum urartu TaxID=4572 RepID=A0A8R7QCK5_TRIUA
SILDATAVTGGKNAADAAALIRLNRYGERAPQIGLLANLDGVEPVPHPRVHGDLQAHRPPTHLLLQLRSNVAGEDAATAPVELHLHRLPALPPLVELGRGRRGSASAGAAERCAAVAELGVQRVVVDADAEAGVVYVEGDGEAVGYDGGIGDGEAGERGGADGGADLVRLEDGPVDEDDDGDREEGAEQAAEEPATALEAAAAAGHGDGGVGGAR